MSNEEIVETTEVVVEQPIEVSKMETVEKPQGHMSPEEWVAAGHSMSSYKGEEAYKKDGKLYEALDAQNRRIKALETISRKFADEHYEAEKKGYERAIQEIKEQQKKAAEIGEWEKVVDLTDKLVELKKPNDIPQPLTDDDTAVADFATNNAWMFSNNKNDQLIRLYAEFQEKTLRTENPTFSTRQILSMVENKVRDQYPEKYGVAKRVERHVPAAEAPTQGDTMIENKNLYQKLPKEYKAEFDYMKKKYGNAVKIEDYYRDVQEYERKRK
jgi:hypothetical protein